MLLLVASSALVRCLDLSSLLGCVVFFLFHERNLCVSKNKMAEAAKKKFEQDRDKTLGDLPASIKDMFGTIGFAVKEEEERIGMHDWSSDSQSVEFNVSR